MSGETIPSADQTKLRFLALQGCHGVFRCNRFKLKSCWNKQVLPYMKTLEPYIWRKIQKAFYYYANCLSNIISSHHQTHGYCLLFLVIWTCCPCQAGAQQSRCFVADTEDSGHLVFWRSSGHPHPHSQTCWKTTLVMAQCSVSIQGLPKAQGCEAGVKTES